jgi:hypothetical protein
MQISASASIRLDNEMVSKNRKGRRLKKTVTSGNFRIPRRNKSIEKLLIGLLVG